MTRGDRLQDARQCSHPQYVVRRNRDMMFRRFRITQSQMAARLPRNPVTESLQSLRQISPGYVAGQPHAAMTSSRVK